MQGPWNSFVPGESKGRVNNMSIDLPNYLLATLPPQVFRLLKADLEPVSLPQGLVLLEPGDPIERIYFPESAMISLLVVTRAGDTIETSVVGREGALGLQRGLGKRNSFTRATVQIAGRFLRISAYKFEQASAASTPLRDMINRYTEVLWAEAQQTAACNAVHDASSRLCRWLLQCAQSVDRDHLTLTQDFLGHMLGVRRTTVTLLAQELQRKGAIKYSRGKISIISRSTLESCACECHQIMQNEALPRKIGVAL
jgi:CRP-like cAMP-binding protein